MGDEARMYRSGADKDPLTILLASVDSSSHPHINMDGTTELSVAGDGFGES